MQVHEASLKFLNDPKSGLKTEGSKKNYRSDLMKLSQERDINSFTEQELLDTCFLPVSKGPREGQRPADSTVYARSKNFQGFFSYCHFMGWIKEDPTRHMKRHISGRGKPVIKHNWLTEDEVMRVLASVDMDSLDGPRDNIFLRLGFTAGLRISELANLRWSDISFDRREISLVGKGGKIAVVSISKNTFGYLHDWHGQAAVAIGRRPHDEMVLPRKFSVSEGKYLKSLYERKITKHRDYRDKNHAFSVSKSYGGFFHLDQSGLKNRNVFIMDGHGGQTYTIDFDKGRIVATMAIHRDFNWKKIAHSVIKKGK